MRRNCTNVIKFSSMAAKSAHISVMLNVRMELLEARFEARSKRAPSHQLPRLLPETPRARGVRVPCLSCSDDLVRDFFFQRWPPILGPGDEQPHLLHVTHILPPFFFCNETHIRPTCAWIQKVAWCFPAFVHDGNLHYPLIFYWNSPTGRASGVETELAEFQLLVAFPLFPFWR